jgi:Fe-S-cluster containining protein
VAEKFNCLEHCPDLGHCCRDFSVVIRGKIIGDNSTREQVMRWVESNRYPFRVLHFDERREMWVFTCHNLGSDGRCTDHVNRPKICQDFQPRSEQSLCCVPKPTIGEYLSELICSLVEKIRRSAGLIRGQCHRGI